MIEGLNLIEKEITAKIIEELDKIGILYRIFSRTKGINSINEKIQRKNKEGTPYVFGGKLIQDLIGIRVVTYFKDDVEIVYSILKTKLNYHEEEIDDIDLTVFKPKRTNIICKFNSYHSSIFSDVQKVSKTNNYNIIDNTFELQLRTILSEGWHEIDHSLRYKCKEDWLNYHENERMLNGIYASLETNDIALGSLFNELAFKHYKGKNWEGLIRNKFRLKFQLSALDEKLKEILSNNNSIGKQIFKIDRKELLFRISSLEISLPVNLNNILYLINKFFIRDQDIFDITPKYILEN